VSGRTGYRAPSPITGEASDLAGFPRLVGEFCTDMAARGYSDRTVGNRRFMLSYLVAWLAERGITRPVEVTRPVLESYQRWLFHYRKANGDPLSFRSQSQRLLAVRAFFKWAARQRHVLHNPASEIELPKAERRLPRPALTAGEAETVLAQPDLDTPTGVRDRAILEVFYSTGIRRFELAGLAVTDLDHERATLLVRQGKGRKDRLVPIGERALAWVGRYLAEVRPRLAIPPDDGTLFLTAEGTGFSLDGLTRLASVYVKASGVPKTGACHLFRHTMATQFGRRRGHPLHPGDARPRRAVHHPDLRPGFRPCFAGHPHRDPPRRHQHPPPPAPRRHRSQSRSRRSQSRWWHRSR
jgi:integrase/recombinase XerD